MIVMSKEYYKIKFYVVFDALYYKHLVSKELFFNVQYLKYLVISNVNATLLIFRSIFYTIIGDG